MKTSHAQANWWTGWQRGSEGSVFQVSRCLSVRVCLSQWNRLQSFVYLILCVTASGYLPVFQSVCLSMSLSAFFIDGQTTTETASHRHRQGKDTDRETAGRQALVHLSVLFVWSCKTDTRWMNPVVGEPGRTGDSLTHLS